MSKKIDGEMMNCCGTGDVSLSDYMYIYESTSNTTGVYTAEYDPSGIYSNTCPVDRRGNSLYATFPAVGDHYANCRSSCLNGHPQDYNFSLNNKSVSAELPIAERGVELYENYGLDTSIRTDSGKYGTSNDYMQCITDLGRKVTLFGNVTFGVNTNLTYVGQPTNQVNPLLVGVDKQIFLGSPDVYYTLRVELAAEAGDRYPYFGNHGVTFHYGDADYPYIHGQIADLPEVGYTINSDSITYYISNTQFQKRVFNLDVGHCKPEAMKIYSRQGSAINSANNSDRCEHWNFASDSAAALFPLPWGHPYFTRSDYTSKSAWTCTDTNGGVGAGATETPCNCYASGAKSAYVPPHMQINSISYVTPTYNSEGKVDDTSDDTTAYNKAIYGVFSKVIKCEDSLYSNGVFPAFGTKSSDLPNGSRAVTTNRNAVIAIPPGTLYSISVKIRQDDNFYNKYIKSANHSFAPEIFLIPGISNASSFAGKLSAVGITSRLGNPLQLMNSASQYWTNANPYWSSNPVTVVVNEKFNPGDVLFGVNDGPPAPNSKDRNINLEQDADDTLKCVTSKSSFTNKVSMNGRDFSSKSKPKSKSLIKDLVDTVAGTNRALALKYILKGKTLAKRSMQAIGFAVTPEPPTGQYRIVSFDVINGVYSIEWLYVLYFCAMNGRKNIQYDNNDKSPTEGQYNVVGCSLGANGQFGKNTCGRECLLFRDDYAYKVEGSNTCAADIAMKSYAGLRNLSIYYGTWQPTSNLFSNECSCLTQQQFCPATFNPLCSLDATNNTNYVTAEMGQCTDSAICNYCNVTVNQLLLTIDGCTSDSGNTITNFGDICGDASCTYVVEDGDDDGGGNTVTQGGGDPNNNSDTTSDTNYWIIILIIIIIVIAIVAIIFVYKKYKKTY